MRICLVVGRGFRRRQKGGGGSGRLIVNKCEQTYDIEEEAGVPMS